jgi:copper chaperone CopZ
VYLMNIIIGSAAFGLGYEALFGTVTAAAVAHHEHTAPWMVLGAVVLSAMLAWFAASDLRALLSRRRAKSAVDAVELAVEGMTCGGCASRLERLLLATEGVQSASVSIEEHRAVVVGIPAKKVAEVIHSAGFTPVG